LGTREVPRSQSSKDSDSEADLTGDDDAKNHGLERRVRTARAAKAAPARKRMTAERTEYQTPLELSARYMPMREKTTAPNDQMSVALLVLFMAPA
jgi:hypothetical protein